MVDEIISKNKKSFHKDSIVWLRLIIMMQLILISALSVFVYVQYTNQPEPVYFSLKKGDQLIEGVSLEKPSLTEAELLNWLTEAMIVSFSFNYYNYDKIIDSIIDYFDPVGKESYIKLIKENKQIQQVVSDKLILSGRPTGAPRIVKDGIVNGRYAWEVSFPFVFKFRNQRFNQDIEITLSLFVVRVPEKQAPLGVKIVQIQDLSNNTRS
jgi:intracellular multiplication protein IcmL